MYIVWCTLYSVQCTCTVYTVQCTCTMYIVQCKLCCILFCICMKLTVVTDVFALAACHTTPNSDFSFMSN